MIWLQSTKRRTTVTSCVAWSCHRALPRFSRTCRNSRWSHWSLGAELISVTCLFCFNVKYWFDALYEIILSLLMDCLYVKDGHFRIHTEHMGFLRNDLRFVRNRCCGFWMNSLTFYELHFIHTLHFYEDTFVTLCSLNVSILHLYRSIELTTNLYFHMYQWTYNVLCTSVFTFQKCIQA